MGDWGVLVILLLLVCLVVFAFCFSGMVGRRGAQDWRRRKLMERDDVGLEELADQLDSIPKQFVVEELRHLGALFHLPAHRLRPTDRFDDELSAGPWKDWDDPVQDIQEDYPGIATVADFLRRRWEEEQEGAQAPEVGST
jgi:hypothetical protein